MQTIRTKPGIANPLAATLILGLATLASGCVGPPGADRELTVLAQSLSPETTRVHFTLSGDGLVGASMGGVGEGGSLTFRRVPEGYKQLRAWGLEERGPSGAHPEFPLFFFRVVESGILPSFGVVSTARTSVEVTLQPSAFPDNVRAGVERYLLSADYDFDSGDPAAGSLDGANITVGLIDGAPGECVDAQIASVGDEEGPVAVGLFEALPATWGDPATWPGQLLLPLNGSGEAVFRVVAKPGRAGQNTLLIVSPGPESASSGCQLSAEIFVRNSGYATVGAAAP